MNRRPPPQRHVSTKVSIGLNAANKIEGTWEADERQQSAAWQMYIELVTRVAVTGARSEQGSIRETLDSLYSLFPTTRNILREYGPAVAKPYGRGSLSFGQIAVVILNEVLRPFLARWHVPFRDYEMARPQGMPTLAHDAVWERKPEYERHFAALQQTLYVYADALARIAEVPFLTANLEATSP